MFKIRDSEANVDWRDISRQRADEPVSTFTTRIFAELDNLAEVVTQDALEGFIPVPLVAQGVAYIANLTDVQQAGLAPLLVNKEQADLQKCAKVVVNRMCQAIARRLILAGVRSDELRTLSFEYHRTKPSTLEFMSTVHLAADRIAARSETTNTSHPSGAQNKNNYDKPFNSENSGSNGKQGKNKGNNRKKKANASAVEEDTPVDEEVVEAATDTRAKQPPAPGQRGASRDPPKCTYCGRLYHLENRCYTKLNHEQAAKEGRLGRTAPASEAATSASASSVSQSGNSNAGW
jgi:hypothetical protein